jgi:hypothetical protein
VIDAELERRCLAYDQGGSYRDDVQEAADQVSEFAAQAHIAGWWLALIH